MRLRSIWCAAAAVVAVVASSCSDDASGPAPHHDPPPQRRVIEPPSNTVRPLPPYAITATEVGPYRLGQKLATLLDKLPSGPRIARFEIPGLLHTGLIRAEDDTVLIGSDSTTSVPSSTTTFVAVVASDVARTESGVHVGTTREELAKLGPPASELDRARDPRLVVSAALRNVRLVVEHDRIVAIVIGGDGASREPFTDTCPRARSTETATGGCFTGVGELFEVDGDFVSLRLPEAEKPFDSVRVPNLVFAAPLRNAAEGRDELVMIARTDEPGARTWTLLAYRFEGKRHTLVVDPQPIYSLTSAQTRWIGADLRDIDLYLEVTSRPDGLEVGGLLTTRAGREGEKVRDVLVISPVSVHRHLAAGETGKSATGVTGEPDGGVSDASASSPGASGVDSAKL